MFAYHGKIAGVAKAGTGWRYVVAIPHPEGLSVDQVGELDAAAPDEAWQALAGSRCIYGLSKGEYSRQRLSLVSEAVLQDPDQLLWELSRACAEAIDNYHFTLLRTHSNDTQVEVTCLAVNKSVFSRIGQSFESRGLLLDRMVFLPEAFRKIVKPRLQAERELCLFEGDGGLHLQLFRRGRLAAFETIGLSGEETIERMTEEIGIVMMAVFGGRTLRRAVTAHLLGGQRLHDIAAVLERQLPYDFTFTDEIWNSVPLGAGLSPESRSTHFSALAPAYAYYLAEVCASSPVNDAALF